MTRDEYFEIKDDCVKNGKIKVITEVNNPRQR